MAIYLLLADHFVPGAGGVYLTAGSVVTDTGPGAQLPPAWIPTPYVDPQDTDAVAKFWAAGPVLPGLGLLRQRWSNVPVPRPFTYWIPNPNPTGGNGNIYREYILTGLGAGLPFQQALMRGGPAP
jgi:hypothetical protein